MKHQIFAISIAGVLLTACSAGSGPAAGTGQQTQAARTVRETALVTIHIDVPPRPALQARYISPSTASIEITFSGGGRVVQNINGAGPYNITFEAPLGNDTYTVTIYDQQNAGGSALARRTTSFTVTKGAANTPSVTLLGIPATINLTVADPRPLVNGTSRNIGMTVAVLDAGGNTITGTYETALTLTGSGATALGPLIVGSNPAANPVSVPDDTSTVNIAYTGNGVQDDVVSYVGTAGGVTSSTVTLTPTSDIRFTANGNSDTITPAFISFATVNVAVTQINGTLPTASGCAGIATTVVTENSAGNYTAAVTPTAPGGGNCTITLTGASAGGTAQTGTINFNFSP